MNYLISSLFLSLSLSIAAYATPPGQWKCMAFDKNEQNFEAAGASIDIAISNATAVCREQSPAPKTCRSAQSFCEQGPLNLQGDGCLVTDDDGHSWETTGKDACKTALALCNSFLNLEGGPRGQCSVKHGGDTE